MSLKNKIIAGAIILGLGLVSQPVFADEMIHADKELLKSFEKSFSSKNIATLDRLKQDHTQIACSSPKGINGAKYKKLRAQIEKENLDAIVYPSDGKYMGDWKKGEKVAASGKGLTWNDKKPKTNGGGCYNCHQLDPKQISYGTIGPSLKGYGKLRGNSEAIVKYTWGKIYNAKAFNACSDMPRNGFGNVLTEDQMKDIMALLLDPKSPVNQ